MMKSKIDNADFSYCIFGANILTRLLKALEKQAEGVEQGDDIEYAHKTRVASRRIRAAMPIFKDCFQKKNYKRWKTKIKKITQSLGMARDADVQIDFIGKELEKLGDEEMQKGIEFLLFRHKERRDGMQPDVINTLDEMKRSRVVEEIMEACEDIIKRSEHNKASGIPPVVYLKAEANISTKINDLLDMEGCVHHEEEALKHHKMRIAAKRLRYTMEVFQKLYPNKIKEEISVIKQLQDVLGDMHDCDVWMEHIPNFIKETKEEILLEGDGGQVKEIKDDLLLFLERIKGRRKSLYADFVLLWDENKEGKFFDRLKDIISLLVLPPEDYPKIAIIADVHANLHALNAVMKDAKNRGADIFLNAGDFVGYGPFPDEVVQILSSSNVLSVIGNYDLKVIRKREAKKRKKIKTEKQLSFEYAGKNLSKSSLDYLRSLNTEMRIKRGEKNLLMVHGSPESIDEHLTLDTPEERLKELTSIADADIVISAHSHLQFSRAVEDVTFINPGSVGRPEQGDRRATYTILGSNPFSVEHITVDYDVEGAADAIRKRKLPENFAQMFLRGVSLDTIIEEENERKNTSGKELKIKRNIEKIRKIAAKYDVDQVHSDQVRKLSLTIFDQMSDLHLLGEEERYWLECAAILHDIGWSQDQKDHHKASLRLILNEVELPFTSRERYIIGSIARYHRKALPSKAHYNFAQLNSGDREKVKILSSIIKVADGIDASHASVVKDIDVKTSPKEVILGCLVSGNRGLEEEAVNEKKKLFEKVFKRQLTIRWMGAPYWSLMVIPKILNNIFHKRKNNPQRDIS